MSWPQATSGSRACFRCVLGWERWLPEHRAAFPPVWTEVTPGFHSGVGVRPGTAIWPPEQPPGPSPTHAGSAPFSTCGGGSVNSRELATSLDAWARYSAGVTFSQCRPWNTATPSRETLASLTHKERRIKNDRFLLQRTPRQREVFLSSLSQPEPERCDPVSQIIACYHPTNVCERGGKGGALLSLVSAAASKLEHGGVEELSRPETTRRGGAATRGPLEAAVTSASV